MPAIIATRARKALAKDCGKCVTLRQEVCRGMWLARLVRKNLMVDAEALSELGTKRGTSESQAVRDAVDIALGRLEMVAALQGLHDIGAFADFEQLFPPLET